ncbi:unnamed protein product, partial [Taenia asiatica]|uniref:Inner membrane protein n=1 Tax=Taenia asiatica TaxID=60517 RepID=A0A0R3WGD2_TAEAS
MNSLIDFLDQYALLFTAICVFAKFFSSVEVQLLSLAHWMRAILAGGRYLDRILDYPEGNNLCVKGSSIDQAGAVFAKPV